MVKKQQKKRDPLSFQQRFYRQHISPGPLQAMEVRVAQSDLYILASRQAVQEARDILLSCRAQLEQYIQHHPNFITSLHPLPPDDLAPTMVKEMLRAGQIGGVGPMAAVAGAVAEYVGQSLLSLPGITEVMVENGGDIFMARTQTCVSAIYAGDSPLSGKVGMRLPDHGFPLGICTSSGTIGHSLSFGKADSVTVLAKSCAVADAAATRLANEVKNNQYLDNALALGRDMAEIQGVVIICDDKLGAWGEVELVGL